MADAGLVYLRARAALELGDLETAARLLTGLEAHLPLLSREIARDRARAQLGSGSPDAAAEYYLREGSVEGRARAALALERAGQAERALELVQGSIRRLEARPLDSERELLIEAHARRAALFEARGKRVLAARDLRWLALEATTDPRARGADDALARLDPRAALSRAERGSRAERFAEAGRLEDTQRELERLAGAVGRGPSAGALTRIRARAYFASRRDYAEAARLFELTSQQDASRLDEDAFNAARALARSQREAEAIERYQAVARRFPRSGFAEEARYQSARLWEALAKPQQARQAYQRYLDLHGRKGRSGRFAKEARLGLALARLQTGEARRAVQDFSALAVAERDWRERAFLRELQGVALLLAEQREAAAQVLRQVIVESPLSFGALAGAARLRAAGLAVPPMVPPAAPGAWTLVRPGVEPAPLDVVLPAKVRALAELGLLRDAELALREVAEPFGARYGARRNEALCAAYEQLGVAAERYRVAQRVVRATALDHEPSEATRWTWECLYPRPYAALVARLEAERALPTDLTHAVMRQESGFRSDVVSSANAVGLMQLLPSTARQLATELRLPFEPESLRSPGANLRFGVGYLAKLLGAFHGNVALALAAYNAGPTTVARWLARSGEVPLDLWVARIPYAETRRYVMRIYGNLARYAYLRGGLDAVPPLDLALPRGVRVGDDAY